MKYTYAYKTPSGTRLEGSMSASSREEVFVALRKKGIRAIKVVAADGSKANGEIKGLRKRSVAMVAVTVAILTGGVVYFLAARPTPRSQTQDATLKILFTNDESHAAFTNLEAQASQIMSRHYAAIKTIDLDLLANYQFIETMQDPAVFEGKVKAGYKAIDGSRMEVRDLFKSLFEIFPAECVVERDKAQQLYVEIMEKLDASERRLVKDEKAAQLLIGNRHKWHYRNGKVIWNDASLANEFEYFRRDHSSVPSRREIGATTIESSIIEIPARK